MKESPVLDVRSVTRRHAGRAIVSDASFVLMAGQIGCLLGPSGCGKSTLLRMIAGLEPLDEGEIRIRDARMSAPGWMVAPEQRGVGLVFQDNALFPHLDVSDNIGFGLAGVPSAERKERIAALLERFQIGHLAAAWPHTLSGGEQQRVAIARALAREPSLLLLDEPFSGLDGHLRIEIRQSLLADLRNTGATVLIVTHDPEEAMMIADELILMSAGRILQTGQPGQCYEQPVSVAAARLLGDVIVVPGEIADGVATSLLGTYPASGCKDGPANIAIRPERLRPGRTGITATVLAARSLGPISLVDLVIGGHRLTLRITGEVPDTGTQIGLQAEANAIRLYPAQTAGSKSP